MRCTRSPISPTSCYLRHGNVDKGVLLEDGLHHLHDFFQELRDWRINDDILRDRLRGALLVRGPRHLHDFVKDLLHWVIDDLLVDPL